MKLVTSVSSVVAPASANLWSQTFSTENFFIVVEASGGAARDKGRRFLGKLEQRLVQTEISTLKDIKNSLFSITQETTGISFTAAATFKTKIFLVVKGTGQVWLGRLNKKAAVLVKNGAAVGLAKARDRLLLLSENMAKKLDDKHIFTALDLPNQAAAEFLSTKLSKLDPLAGSILLVSLDKENFRNRFYQTGNEFKRAFIIWIKKASVASKPKVFPMLLVVLVLFLLISIFVGIGQQKQKQQQSQLDQVLSKTEHQYQEGLALIDLNPVRARELLLETKKELEKQLESAGTEKGELQAYLDKVNQAITLALKQYQVNLTPFFELTLVNSRAEGIDMSLYQDSLAILDTVNKSIYTIRIPSKTAKVVAGDENLRFAKAITIHGEEIYVLTDVVSRVQVPQGNLTEMIPSSVDWGDIRDLVAYAGNLYLLDSKSQQIWKYAATEAGFGSIQKYLRLNTRPDFTNAQSLSIDGAVWVVKEKEISKFLHGELSAWSVRGLDQDWGDSIDFYSDDTCENVYILDKDQQRLIVVDRTGLYLSWYHWSDAVSVTDFVVSEKLKKALFLSHDTIYEIGLK